MNPSRFARITAQYPRLRVGLVGDFCLDRYLEIDPRKSESSLETGLPVHNVVNVRSQPGAAGTILNNLVALGVGEIHLVGFCGEDGEGYELQRCLRRMPGAVLDHFIATPERRTFTYCKPLLVRGGQSPQELNRLDIKNWDPTPDEVQERLCKSITSIGSMVDALIVMDQADLPETGVVTSRLLHALSQLNPKPLILADSRRELRDFPPLGYKMNGREFATLTGSSPTNPEAVQELALALSAKTGHPVFVTLAEHGIAGALPNGTHAHCSSLPVRGEIDVVGAGDSVTANLTAALAAGAELIEALELSMAAASLVVHQLGTTGTASVTEIKDLLLARSIETLT